MDDTSQPYTVLVLCNTRELAYQIKGEFDRFLKYMDSEKYTIDVVYGGQPFKKQAEALKKKKPMILIGTPGRTLALCKAKAIDLSNVKHFIVDECDQMLEALDMRADIQNIFVKCQTEK